MSKALSKASAGGSSQSGGVASGGEQGDGKRQKKDGSDDDDKRDNPSDPDDPPFDFDNEGDYGSAFTITVQKLWGTPSFKNFEVCPHYPLHSLKAMISMEWGVKPSGQKLMMKGNPIDSSDFLSFAHLNITGGSLLQVSIRARGGAGGIPVQKGYLKRDQAFTQMKQKVREQHIPDDGLNIPNENLPQKFVEFLTEEKEKLAQISMLKSRLGDAFTRTILRQVDVETLCSLKSIFESNRSKMVGTKNLTITEKVSKAMHLMHPQIKTMSLCVDKMVFTQGEAMSEVVEMFNLEFGTYSEQHGTLKISGDGFLEKIKAEIDRRDDRPTTVSDETVSNCNLS